MALPDISAAARFTSGAAIRQGPHHAAQKSTSIGTWARETISLNDSESASMGSPTGGKSALHAPQRPLSARCSGGIRFFLAQEGHCRIIVPNYKLEKTPFYWLPIS